eukprot:762961-Hanusia_phi.AAC.18
MANRQQEYRRKPTMKRSVSNRTGSNKFCHQLAASLSGSQAKPHPPHPPRNHPRWRLLPGLNHCPRGCRGHEIDGSGSLQSSSSLTHPPIPLPTPHCLTPWMLFPPLRLVLAVQLSQRSTSQRNSAGLPPDVTSVTFLRLLIHLTTLALSVQLA